MQPLLLSLSLEWMKRLITERQIFKISQMHGYYMRSQSVWIARHGVITSDTQDSDIALLTIR